MQTKYAVPHPKLAFDYLQEIINTMHKVNDYNAITPDENKKTKFNMTEFIKINSVTSEHLCGTSACICGYQAIEENKLADLSIYNVSNQYSLTVILKSKAAKVSYKLDKLLGEELASSIYEESSGYRMSHAEDCEMDDITFSHLILDTPTPLDAIQYMQYIQTICKEQM